jgi:hypothetical protein
MRLHLRSGYAIGLRYGRDTSSENPKAVWDRVDGFIGAFRGRWGALTCRELTGLDVKTTEGMKKYLASIHDYACTEHVKYAVSKAIEVMEN